MIPLSAVQVDQFTEDGPLYVSTSQCGEDAVVHYFFEMLGGLKERKRFYIDVGAHHPRFASNTALLHSLGWSGINIDANPDLIEAFKRERPNDINIAVGVARERGSLPFYCFRDSTGMNTFSAEFRDSISSWAGESSERILPVAPLREILAPHLKPGVQVDYLNIDIEGLDDVAVETYDFDGFPPTLVSIEVHDLNLQKPDANRVVQLMNARGYRLMSYTLCTAFFTNR